MIRSCEAESALLDNEKCINLVNEMFEFAQWKIGVGFCGLASDDGCKDLNGALRTLLAMRVFVISARAPLKDDEGILGTLNREGKGCPKKMGSTLEDIYLGKQQLVLPRKEI